MALAKYFSKNLLALSQVLKNANSNQFQSILDNTVIGIAFNEEIKKHEGAAALDLSVRLIARLYPKINFINLDSSNKDVIVELKKLAASINSKIEFVTEQPSVVLVIGNCAIERSITNGPVYFIGSNGWVTKFSSENPVRVGNTNNPLAAGVAACIGASNIFRYVFSDFLSSPEFDEDFSLSLITLDTVDNVPDAKNKTVDIGHAHLVGFGAIGNGFLWALKNSPFLKGTLTLVEPEKLDLSNLQRYILAEERHIEKPKIELAKESMQGSKVDLRPFAEDWAGYLNKKGWNNQTVIVAIDNAQDRINIQASLPESIINSYTENNVIGISRHFDFINETCLACIYMPSGKQKSHSQQVADNLNLSQHERFIRDYIFYNKNADDQLLNLVAQANNIEPEKLQAYNGLPVQQFYSSIVCGGTLMELRNDHTVVEHVEAPLAFQSAMAGILELSELIITKAGLRKEKMNIKTQFYPLSPIKSGVNPYNHDFAKDNSGRCMCADQDFQGLYMSKWKTNKNS
ncbi:MAG: E2 ligase fold family C protein [Bacteroidota bacterium]|nr:E2 ligase fold family C protein [Bacteroidota bacterium]MDP3144236.1 E2 ligase fold family C protein [Bacteroidota bacterium]